MAETLRELVVALSLDSSNFSRNMRSINQQIKEAESTFRLAGAGVENFEKTVAGTEAKLSMLGNKLTQQNRAVEQYSRALVAANDKLKENYDRHKDYSARLEQAKARQEALRFEVETSKVAYEHYRDTLGETDSATIAAKQNLERYQEEHAEATAEVTKLEGQVKALQKTMQNSADTASKVATDLNNAKAAARDTEAEIKRLTEQLYRMQSAWTQAGETLTAISKKCETLSKSLTKAGRTMTRTITTPILGLGTAAVKASIDYEYAFADVRKTVEATEEEYEQLSDSVKQMSTEVAASAEDIAEVMSIAGQLGIENEHLAEFSRTMIDLGNSTNMVAADAASQAARFANIMGMSQEQFQNLGSTLVDLGNNYATTESEIMEMSLRLAGAGKQVGLSEAQIMGFAAALSSVGIQAQMGGSAFSKALIKMEVAAATGGDALEDFARVSGMSASQFKDLWERDAASAFQAFIVGLSKMDEEGVSAIKTLDDIGIAEIRLRDTLLRATNATELFSKTQATANKAWAENSALTTEANKRYATTKSRLINLKNTAVMFARQIGDDLNPTIQQIIESVNGLLQKFLSLDQSQRESIVKWAAFAAAVGPVVLILGKVVGAVGKVTGALGTAFTAIGKFSAKVSMAGGGLGGLVKTLASSKLAMVALAAAVVYGAVKLVDYASGAKAAREALEGMAKTAKEWKETEADTFYSRSKGLSFFSMSKEDFQRDTASAQEWMNGVLGIWSDGKKETDEIISEWTESFKSLTASTRESLQEMKDTADAAGYTSVSDQLQADIKTLDAMDKEIAALLKKRKNRKLTEKDKVRLQELIDTREAIEVKYHLTAADTEGFTTIRKKVEAEIARAEARGQEVSGEVYQEAMVAAAEGMASVNSALDTQYDKEYAVIQLIEDAAERQAALDALNAKYNADRRAAAQEYAQLMADMVNPVWQQDNVQEAKGQIGELMQLLRQYSTAKTDEEKKAFLPDLQKLTASMDEGALTEYVSLLTQIQSLLDSGMSEEEVQTMFPDIDFTTALDQLAAIQQFLKDNKWDTNLTSLNEMFGEAVGDEVLKITTDLDMTGAKARWEEWASNPGAITTDAIIAGYTEAENAEKQQPVVEAFVSKYTEIPEGASTAQLTPEGILAYVTKYAESTTGVDVSRLNPTNVTGIVSAYKELASGTDVSQLKPSEITAYVFKYLEENKVDTTGLTPGSVTATVMAYEEITGGASTAALKPSDIVGLIVKYAEAENVDLSALNSAQVEGIVTKFSEATGCDKSELMKEFVAYITEYKEINGVKKPTLNMQVGLSGYDMLAYRQWLKNNKVEIEGIVRLSEAYEDPTGALHDPGVKFWKDGQEIPVSAVTEDMLKPEDVAVLDKDGTMHVLITAEVSGAPEAIAEMREQVAEVDQLGMTAFGSAMTGIMPASLLDFIKSAEQRIKNAKGDLDQWYNFIYGGNEGILRTLDQSMQSDFNADRMAQLSTYVAEVVAAIKNGEEVSREDIDNLKKILQFVQDLDSVGVGGNVTAGIAEGMTEAGWDTTAETVADNLETAINSAFIIESPSQRMKPTGEYVAAGIGAGMAGYDFTTDATSMVTALQTAMSATLPGTLKNVGVNAMAGLKEGINSGRFSVITALRSAVQSAVAAAKAALKIASPSKVFRDEIDEISEKGISGYKVSATDRDAIVEIKKRAAQHQFDVLLVFMFDRLGRRDDETPFVVQWFVQQGIEVWSAREGEQRFDNHVDKLLNYIRFWRASGESEKTAIRVRTRHSQMVQDGQWRGGLVAYGYRLEFQGRTNKKGQPVRDLLIDEEEAAVVRDIFRLITVEGYGTNKVASHLNMQGIKTKRGTTLWRGTSIRAIISNPIYKGVLRFGDELSPPIERLRIVSDEEFDCCEALVKGRAPERPEKPVEPIQQGSRNLLTGLIFCGYCGNRLCYSHNKTHRKLADGTEKVYDRHLYRCYRRISSPTSCEGPSAYEMDPINEAVEVAVRDYLNRISIIPREDLIALAGIREVKVAEVNFKQAVSEFNDAQRQVDALEAEALKALTGENQLDLGVVNSMLLKQKARLDAAAKKKEEAKVLLEMEKNNKKANEVQVDEILSWASRFDDASYEAKHLVIAQLVDRIEIRKNDGYDITIHWRMTAEQFLGRKTEESA